MLKKSTFQLLRFHFSIFLMPIFWFAVSQVGDVNIFECLLVFFILHFLVYPASNGYNSYMDRDTESIGGVEKPLMPTKQLFYITQIMDAVAIGLSFFISPLFALGIFLFILASKAYSWRKIRLKKYPIAGYLTVVFFQGGFSYFLMSHGISQSKNLQVSPIAMLAASLLIGGFYPLTQIYQHRQDAEDGVETLSLKLGLRGTFIFTAILYFFAMLTLAFYFATDLNLSHFFVFQIFMLPVLVYFFVWMKSVWKNPAAANFKNTMRMNIVGALCTNAGFISIIISDKL